MTAQRVDIIVLWSHESASEPESQRDLAAIVRALAADGPMR